MKESDAVKLWEELRNNFQNAEATLREIIQKKAWVPLGYDTFSQAWSDKMRGIRLASVTTRAVVAYALLDEGLSIEEVVRQTNGKVTDTMAAYIDQQRQDGIPVSLIKPGPNEYLVQAHAATRPSLPRFLHVEFTPDCYAELKAIAEERGLNMKAEAAKAIVAHFREKEHAKR